MTDEDFFIQWRFCALFIHNVLSQCASAGVSPLTATTELNLSLAFSDAEKSIGTHYSDSDIETMNHELKLKVIEVRTNRRRWAYLVMLRLFSSATMW